MKEVLVLLLFILLSSLICFSGDSSGVCKPPSSTSGNDNPDESFMAGYSLASLDCIYLNESPRSLVLGNKWGLAPFIPLSFS